MSDDEDIVKKEENSKYIFNDQEKQDLDIFFKSTFNCGFYQLTITRSYIYCKFYKRIRKVKNNDTLFSFIKIHKSQNGQPIYVEIEMINLKTDETILFLNTSKNKRICIFIYKMISELMSEKHFKLFLKTNQIKVVI